MKRWAFLFTFIFSLNLVYGQSRYSDYTSSSKTEIVVDDFNFNSNKLWVGDQGTYRGSIQNGYYLWESSGNSSMYVPIRMEMNEEKDYQIETKIKFVAGEQNKPQSLMWNMDTETGWAFYFDITNTQYYRIYMQTDQYEEIIPWTFSSLVKKNEYNLLTVRKAGYNMYFFINKILVHTMTAEPFFGDFAAISVPQYTTIHVDYIYAHYLKERQVVFNQGGGGKESDPTSYYSYTASNRKDVYNDNFSSDRGKWWEGDDANNRSSHENGYWHWQSKVNNSRYLPLNMPELDEYKDFEIEMKVKFAAGTGTDNGYGLKWGKPKDDWHGYAFYLTNTGYYRIYKSQDYPEEYVPWTRSSLVKAYAYNTLTLRKVDRTFYFFLNQQLIHSMPYQSFLGDQIAFVCPKNSTTHIDHFRVSHLTKKQTQVENIAPSIVITEPTLSRGFKVVEVDTKTTRIAGVAHDADGISEVLVNGQRATLQSDGKFSTNIQLTKGSNSILVKATDKRMKSAVKSFTIDHEEKRVTTTQKRLALVIGNAAYESGGSLKNPINDANGMKVALEQLGFEVMKFENCDQKNMKKAIDQFGQKLAGYDVGLFFYAGHGLQVKGSNYLIPTDARLENENEVEYDCVRADRVLMVMENAKVGTNLVILDACRNNPFERSWSRSANGNGLAFMNAPKGSLIAYATSPGNTASDGAGDNGLYTEALLREITKPNITILEMFQNVRATVVKRSDSQQTPWESTSLIGNFYFKKE
ncbi:MAG: caspase family protein [Flammeovirgaceae bacterium]